MNDYVNVITSTDEETGDTNIYPIEGQRLSCGSVGDESHPVYFDSGIPIQCSGDIGGGGDNVIITPDPNITALNRSEKSTIATFQINDGRKQNLEVPRYSSGFQKVTLFDRNTTSTDIMQTGGILDMDFTKFQFLYIYIKDNKDLIGTHVEIVPVPPLAEQLPNNAYISCNLFGTLGMIIKFTSPTGFTITQVNKLPNYDTPDSEDGSIGVILTKIEGYTLGISKGSWGVNTKEGIWAPVGSEGGVVDPTTKYSFANGHTLSEFDYIYVHGCISGETEEHIDVGAVDHFKDLFDEEEPAYLTCGTFQNITKTLLFEDDGFYIYAGNNVDNLTYSITRIEGIKFGAEINSNTIVDAPINDDMHAITSNAVYDALDGLSLLKITQEDFDALVVKNPNTLYLIGEWT